MRIARGESPVGHCKTRSLLQRREQHRCRIIELAFEEIRCTQRDAKDSQAVTRAEAQGGLEVLDRDVGLPGNIPQHGAPHPTAGKAGVEGKRAVDRADGEINVLAKKSEREGGGRKDLGVIWVVAERPSSEIDALATVCLQIIDPAVHFELMVTKGCQGEGGAVMRIAFDRLPEQVEGLKDAVLLK